MTNDAILDFDEFCDLDITSGRHRGSQESMEAFAQASLAIKDRHRDILRLYERNGAMTAKEVAQCLGKQLNTISGRLSELRAGQYLEPTGLRREGSAVLRLTAKEWA
jgi:predicted HTH transcriptional regulator